jgi:sugar lactone lactonase YvrE
MEIEVALAAGAIIGESPTWASAERVLYWIDVKKPALYRFDPETGDQRVWSMTSDIGAFGLGLGSAGRRGCAAAGDFSARFCIRIPDETGAAAI